jgi:hypothetical protein
MSSSSNGFNLVANIVDGADSDYTVQSTVNEFRLVTANIVTGAAGADGADSVVPGPQGPQGATGATGPQGPVGPEGPAGTSSAVISVKDYGALCDGGSSQNGSLALSGVVTDASPNTVLPVAGQTFTWVGRGAPVGGGIAGIAMASSGEAPIVTTNTAHGLASGDVVTIAGIVGLIVKSPVRVASTANINRTNPGTNIIDGVTLSTFDRVLLKDQTVPAENGVYVFQGSSSAMTRASDADTNSEVKSGDFVLYVAVTTGTVNGSQDFYLTNTGSITLGTTALNFAAYPGTSPASTGLVGSIELNAVWPITVTSSTSFSVPLNTASLTPYLAGGEVSPQTVISGYVSNPVVNSGVLTFTAVTTKNGSTSVTVPVGTLAQGAYYYGTDDIAAWNAAISDAQSVSLTDVVAIEWTGVSMVSSTVIVKGNVLIRGQWMDYTNPNGTQALSSYPQRGSILRATGNFANKKTSAVLQLGVNNSLLSGDTGASTFFGTIDAANICQSALRTVGVRNWSNQTYAMNGTQRAFDWRGSNSIAIECVAGMSNTGDALYVSGADCKWKGGYIRQACNGVHNAGAGDFYIGNGVHIFSGYNGGNEQFGNDILADGNTDVMHIGNVILDGTIGPQIRLAPAAGKTQSGTLINGFTAFQPTATSGIYFPCVEIDTTASGSAISGVTVANYALQGNPTDKYSAILGLRGSGAQTKVVLGPGTANYCSDIYSTDGVAIRPRSISDEISIYNGASTKYSSARGLLTPVADGATAVFTVAHNLTTTPNDLSFGSQTLGGVGVYGFADANSLTFRFPTPPSAGTPLGVWYRAAI